MQIEYVKLKAVEKEYVNTAKNLKLFKHSVHSKF